MENQCCDDIFTLHAPLIHAATDIQFALAYLNGILPATITDIDKKNVQQVLERYFSLWGVPVFGEHPIGAKNRVNLVFTTQFEFVVGSIQVWLSGELLNGKQDDPDRDYDVHPNNQGFTLRLSPQYAFRLNKAPRQDEPLSVNYLKRITFNTKGGT